MYTYVCYSLLVGVIHIHMYIPIYIYIYRERERDIHMCYSSVVSSIFSSSFLLDYGVCP